MDYFITQTKYKQSRPEMTHFRMIFNMKCSVYDNDDDNNVLAAFHKSKLNCQKVNFFFEFIIQNIQPGELLLSSYFNITVRNILTNIFTNSNKIDYELVISLNFHQIKTQQLTDLSWSHFFDHIVRLAKWQSFIKTLDDSKFKCDVTKKIAIRFNHFYLWKVDGGIGH